jgi:hypothetical protein
MPKIVKAEAHALPVLQDPVLISRKLRKTKSPSFRKGVLSRQANKKPASTGELERPEGEIRRRCWWEGVFSPGTSEAYSNRGSFSAGTQSRMDRARPGVFSMSPLRSKVLIIS